MSAASKTETTQKVAGRYTILSLIGTGGMAKVYRARDDSLGRTIALKQLTSVERAAAELFEAEFHTLAGLSHRAIIQVYDYGVDVDGPFYTMELLDGGDVSTQAPMPWRLVCACLRDVGGALAVVHRRELVHRDISPRNVWRTTSDGFKVIDFGALTAFGVPDAVVGTPAFMAPESATAGELDQRSDLYSLGAVAYYLLTGRRAHTARSLEEFAFSQVKPVPPSAFVTGAELDTPDGVQAPIEGIPPALDELVLSLLSRTALARPFSAAEVIERACAIAELPVDERSLSNRPQPVSAEFVGRERETALLGEAIVGLGEGKGAAIVVAGSPGQGKTRLLLETKVDARLAGVTVLYVEARLHPDAHGAAVLLARRLLESHPELSRELALPHAGSLAHLTELREHLGYSGPKVDVPAAPGEARMRIQEALFGWFEAVSKREKLAVFVDDADQLDDASGAFVAALARSTRDTAILVVATSTSDDERVADDPMKVLLAAARVTSLDPLPLSATRSLLRSAFGDVPSLPRVAEKLHEKSRGNPQRYMDLVQHLVRHEVIHHHGGTWILPLDLRNEQLPDSFDAVLARHFDRLARTAKDVARILALHGGLLSVEVLCSLLDEEQPGRVSMAVDTLIAEGIASGSRTGCRLVARYAAHVGTIDALRAMKAHRKLAAAILGRPEISPADRLEAGLHLLRAGDDDQGSKLVARGGIDIITNAEELPRAVGTLEAALEIYREQKRPPAELATVLGPLATAAYYSDHRLAARYGDEAVEILQGVLGLTLATRLRRFLGKRLSVFIGIAVAAVRLKRLSKTGRAPSLREAFALLFSAVSTLTGVYVIYIDRARALRQTAVLEPLTALGKSHVATFMYEFSRNLVMTIENTSGQARAAWRRMLERLRDDQPIEGLPEARRVLYVGGALYACGVLESWADGPGALRMAEELDAMGMKLYEMSADQLRALYYANQGIAERFQYYRERVETHAIQRGTAWQVEIWWHSALIATHLRGHDAMGMKHTRDVLERLAHELPSLALYARRSSGAYAVMRGHFAEGIATLEASRTGDEEFIVGANRTVALLARAYNGSGNPARARELCEEALSGMTRDDNELVAMNQLVLTELSLAEARLGNFEKAENALDALIAEHLPREGPLTLGTLYEARATVALQRERTEDARGYLKQMASWYERTGLPSLAARSESLLSKLDRRVTVGEELSSLGIVDDVSETMIVSEA